MKRRNFLGMLGLAPVVAKVFPFLKTPTLGDEVAYANFSKMQMSQALPMIAEMMHNPEFVK